MSYKLKGQKIIIDGVLKTIIPSTLPVSPTDGMYAIDSSDNKLKVWKSSVGRWIILGDAFDQYFLSENSTPTRSNGFQSVNVQEAIEEARTSFVGKGFQFTFVENGTAINTWLKQEDSTIPSNESPAVIPFNARLVGATFTNANQNSDPEIRVAISNAASTSSTINRSFKWSLTNKRTGVWTNTSTGFTVSAGEKLAVYVQDNGGNAVDPVIILHFIVTSDSNKKIEANHSGDLNSSSFPGSIPNIFS